MTVNTASGTRVFIGTTAPIIFPADYDDSDPVQNAAMVAQFESDSYVEVGEVEDLGEFGDEAELVPFASLQDGRVRKYKGTRDAGTMPITTGHDPTDEGQAALVAAEASPLDFNIKIVLNNATTLGGDGEVNYMFGKISSKRKNVGTANNIVRKSFNAAINSPIVEIAPT